MKMNVNFTRASKNGPILGLMISKRRAIFKKVILTYCSCCFDFIKVGTTHLLAGILEESDLSHVRRGVLVPKVIWEFAKHMVTTSDFYDHLIVVI